MTNVIRIQITSETMNTLIIKSIHRIFMANILVNYLLVNLNYILINSMKTYT